MPAAKAGLRAALPLARRLHRHSSRARRRCKRPAPPSRPEREGGAGELPETPEGSYHRTPWPSHLVRRRARSRTVSRIQRSGVARSASDLYIDPCITKVWATWRTTHIQLRTSRRQDRIVSLFDIRREHLRPARPIRYPRLSCGRKRSVVPVCGGPSLLRTAAAHPKSESDAVEQQGDLAVLVAHDSRVVLELRAVV